MKLFFCVALVLCLMLSGCSYDAGSLLALPRTEENERILANQIFPLITNQIEYALPSSGDMTVPALDIDLTGDGTLETVSCLFKKYGGDLRPCVEVYAYPEGSPQLVTEIVGEGDHIDAIYFPILDESGTVGIVVGWGLAGSSLHGVTVGAFFEGHFETLYSSSYQEISVTDMDRDGFDEILFVTHDAATAELQAMMLDYVGGGFTSSVAPLSQGITLQKVLTANIGFDRVALLCEGYLEAYGYLTDVILCTASGELVNAYRSELTGVSDVTARSYPVWCMDANNDGIVELPMPREVVESSEDHSVHMTLIDWCRCDENAALEVLYTTYSTGGEGWYMRLPDQMSRNVLPVHSVDTEDVSATLFYFLSGEGERGLPLWEIYVLSGEEAEETEYLCALQRLAVSDGKIYAIRIYNTISSSLYTEESLIALFSLVSSGMIAEESAS